MPTYTPSWCKVNLEDHPGFKSKYKDNPIESLEVIKTLVRNSLREKYCMFPMAESLRWLMNIKQYENNIMIDCVKTF